MARTGVVDGRDLMVFIDKAGTFSAQAAATSHTITYTSEIKERLTKDSPGGATERRISGVNVSIQCEALVTVDSGDYATLLAAMKAKALVKLKYGFAEPTAGESYEEGSFVIDSLEQVSGAGEDATYSASFSSSGAVETKQEAAP